MKIKEYFITWGCYMSRDASKLIVTHEDDATEECLEDAICKELYQIAYEATDSWVGMHGFDIDEEDKADEEEAEEVRHMLIEENLEYTIVAWDEEEHASSCIYGYATEPATIEWKF